MAETSFEVGGLSERGTYTFNVRAHNARGWSVAGRQSAKITMPSCGALKPDAPLRPRLSQIGSCSASVAWAAPSGHGTGGAPILEQEVRARPKGSTAESADVVTASVGPAAAEAVVSGLQARTTYFFTVRARNVLGWSAPSDAISGSTPAASGSREPSQPLAPGYADRDSGAAAAGARPTTGLGDWLVGWNELRTRWHGMTRERRRGSRPRPAAPSSDQRLSPASMIVTADDA